MNIIIGFVFYFCFFFLLLCLLLWCSVSIFVFKSWILIWVLVLVIVQYDVENNLLYFCFDVCGFWLFLINVGGLICGGVQKQMLLFEWEVVMGISIGDIVFKFVVDDGLLLDFMDLDLLSD